MSYVSDAVQSFYEQTVDKYKRKYAARDLWSPFNKGFNQVQDFLNDERDKSALRGAEITTFMRGLPIVGGIINGIEGVQQLEDLYNSTGKVPAYPGSSGPGAQGLAHAGVGVARKIEEGLNDLGEYYSGDRDLNNVFDNHGTPIVKYGTRRISKYGGF